MFAYPTQKKLPSIKKLTLTSTALPNHTWRHPVMMAEPKTPSCLLHLHFAKGQAHSQWALDCTKVSNVFFFFFNNIHGQDLKVLSRFGECKGNSELPLYIFADDTFLLVLKVFLFFFFFWTCIHAKAKLLEWDCYAYIWYTYIYIHIYITFYKAWSGFRVFYHL